MLFYEMGAGPPLGHEATPNRTVLRQGLIAICATEATLNVLPPVATKLAG